MKINTLLGTAISTLLVLSIITFSILHLQSQNLNANTEKMVTVDQILLMDINEMYAMGLQTGQATRNILINPKDEQAKANYLQAHEEFIKNNKDAETLSNSETKAKIIKIGELWDQDHAVKTIINQHSIAGNQDEAISLLNKTETPLWREIKKNLLDVKKIQEEALHLRLGEVRKSIQTLKMLNISNILLLILTLTVIWLMFQNKIIKPIFRVAEGLAESANQVTLESRQISSESQSLAEGASEQAASIEETSASLEEMSAIMHRNAENTEQVDVLIKHASQVVNQANDSMAELTGSMEQISAASQEISKINKTIDEIAFQTNLLALNAAVEAARAGAAGAGFAVVADEVRNLAMRSAEAARNTAGLIESTVRKVKDGSDVVVKTNSAFSQVADSVLKARGLVGDITAASREQAIGVEQVSTAVASMDRVVQQAAASAEESASLSVEMSNQADNLKSVVESMAILIGGHGRKTPGEAASASRTEKTVSPSHRAGTGDGVKPMIKKRFVSRSRTLLPEAIASLKKDDFMDF